MAPLAVPRIKVLSIGLFRRSYVLLGLHAEVLSEFVLMRLSLGRLPARLPAPAQANSKPSDTPGDLAQDELYRTYLMTRVEV